MSGLQTDFDMPWQRLKQKWEDTKTLWNDPVSRDFEERFMVPLAEQINQTQNALEKLSNMIAQAKRNMR